MTQPVGAQSDQAHSQQPRPDQQLNSELAQLQQEMLAHICELDNECMPIGLAPVHDPQSLDQR